MIVCDLDETLLKDDGSLSEKNIAAIRRASDQGVYFVPNSGRSYTSFQQNLDALGLRDQAGQYSISYNGGLIVENKNNRPLAINAMPFADAKQVFEVGVKNPQADTHVYTQDQVYIYHPLESDVTYLNNRGVEFQVLQDDNFEQFKQQNIMKIIMALPTMAQRKQMKSDVEQVVSADKLAVTFSSDRYVEFNPAGVNKGSAAIQLGGLLGIKPEEIIGAGDNSNDIPMLQAVGLPVSVANGIESVKNVANYITQADNNNDALAEIIERFIA